MLCPSTKVIMSSRKQKARHQTWSIPAKRHDEVARLLKDDNLQFTFRSDDDCACERNYDTNIMGRFICHNMKCSSSGWASKKVAITIRMYHGKQQGLPSALQGLQLDLRTCIRWLLCRKSGVPSYTTVGKKALAASIL